MTASVLDKIKLLPVAKQQEIEDFIDFLASKYLFNDDNSKSLVEMRRKNLGRFNGQIYMAEDFNETPSDFDDYL